ncbi:MAG TPA: hypothetical protein VF267_14215 [Gammaproteobacteria bacterium]
MNDPDYVVKRRIIRDDVCDATSRSVYLGNDGRWCALINQARKFASLEEAEAALQDAWMRLRNAGERAVILSLMKAPFPGDGQAMAPGR